MQTAFYPSVTGGPLMALMTVKQQLELDSGYLDRDECPYDDQIKADMRVLLAPKVVEVEKIVEVEKVVEKRVEVAAQASQTDGKRGAKLKGVNMVAIDLIGKEIAETLNDLRQLKLNAKTLQPKDKLDIMKVQASLLEKLTMLEERNVNTKRMSLFISTIMGVLDDLMPEDMRQEFMKRLKPFAEAE